MAWQKSTITSMKKHFCTACIMPDRIRVPVNSTSITQPYWRPGTQRTSVSDHRNDLETTFRIPPSSTRRGSASAVIRRPSRRATGPGSGAGQPDAHCFAQVNKARSIVDFMNIQADIPALNFGSCRSSGIGALEPVSDNS